MHRPLSPAHRGQADRVDPSPTGTDCEPQDPRRIDSWREGTQKQKACSRSPRQVATDTLRWRLDLGMEASKQESTSLLCTDVRTPPCSKTSPKEFSVPDSTRETNTPSGPPDAHAPRPAWLAPNSPRNRRQEGSGPKGPVYNTPHTPTWFKQGRGLLSLTSVCTCRTVVFRVPKRSPNLFL